MEANKEEEDKGRTVNRNKGKHTHTQAEKGTFGVQCRFFSCIEIRYSLAS